MKMLNKSDAVLVYLQIADFELQLLMAEAEISQYIFERQY